MVRNGGLDKDDIRITNHAGEVNLEVRCKCAVAQGSLLFVRRLVLPNPAILTPVKS